MKTFFRKLFVYPAKKIIELEEAIVAKEENLKKKLEEAYKIKRQKEQLREASISKIIKENIYNQLKQVIEKLRTEPRHIKVGDRVIVNKYNIKYDSSNHWDLGSRSLTTNEFEFNKNHRGPIYAKIKSIEISYDRLDDLIERFIDKKYFLSNNLTDGELANSGNLFVQWYDSNRQEGARRVSPFYSNFGLYLIAKFELENIDFKPQWGLNIYSFLSADSEEGNKTINIWKSEEEIFYLEKEIEKLKNELEESKIS